MERLDWADGDYAQTATTLVPAAEVAVEAAGVGPGMHVLDVACGTGNVALAAVARGAAATGVDAAAGLVELARERAAGQPAEFLVGEAGALPVPDAAFDAVISVFGVIFAPEPDAAAAELLRVARPGAPVVVAAWRPGGPITTAGRLLHTALVPEADAARVPAWGDPEWIEALLRRHGAAEVRLAEHELAFTAASPAGWFEDQVAHHPVWRAGRRALDDERWADIRERSVAALAAGNEEPEAFRTTSRYLVATARTQAAGGP